MINRKEPPFSEPISEITLQKPEIKPLSGGSHLYLFKDIHLDLLHITIEIAAGRIYEPQRYISQALFPFLKESSAQYPKEFMDQQLDYYGSSWNTSVNLQNAHIELIIPKRNFQTVFSFVIDAIAHPDFNAENLEDFKKSRIKNFEYNIRKNSYIASQLMLKNLYEPGTPLATPLDKSHIETLTIEELQKFHKMAIQANRITVFAAGNIEEAEETVIEEAFRQIPNDNPSFSVTSQLRTECDKFIFEPKESSLQSSILICKKHFSYNHPDRRNFSILNTILGGYFGSRLMQKVREQCGYTYGIYSDISYLMEHSFLYIESDVIGEKTKEAVEACYEEIHRLQTEEVSEEELSIVKSYLSGVYLRSVDGITSYMKTYIRWRKFGLDEQELSQLFDTIKKITSHTILTLAQRYLQRDSLFTIIVGKQ